MENDRSRYAERESGFSYGQGEAVKRDGNERRRETAARETTLRETTLRETAGKDNTVKEEVRESGMLRRAPSYGYMNALASSKGEEIQAQTPSRAVTSSMQSSIGTTPTRPKRSYQYVYE